MPAVLKRHARSPARLRPRARRAEPASATATVFSPSSWPVAASTAAIVSSSCRFHTERDHRPRPPPPRSSWTSGGRGLLGRCHAPIKSRQTRPRRATQRKEVSHPGRQPQAESLAARRDLLHGVGHHRHPDRNSKPRTSSAETRANGQLVLRNPVCDQAPIPGAEVRCAPRRRIARGRARARSGRDLDGHAERLDALGQVTSRPCRSAVAGSRSSHGHMPSDSSRTNGVEGVAAGARQTFHGPLAARPSSGNPSSRPFCVLALWCVGDQQRERRRPRSRIALHGIQQVGRRGSTIRHDEDTAL